MRAPLVQKKFGSPWVTPERPFIRPLLKALRSVLTGGRGGVVSAEPHSWAVQPLSPCFGGAWLP